MDDQEDHEVEAECAELSSVINMTRALIDSCEAEYLRQGELSPTRRDQLQTVMDELQNLILTIDTGGSVN